jgi:hypothetical protein
MRNRIVLFVVLAVVLALVGVYVGWSTNTPEAIGEPAPATPTDASGGSTQRRDSGAEPASPPKAPPPKAPPPKAPPPKAPPPKAPPPKASPPKACSTTAAAQPAAYATPSGQEPEAEPASQPQETADPVRFGKVTTTPSNDTVETGVSDDRRALTTTFSDREVEVGNGGSTECDATLSFAMTLSITDGAEGETLWIQVQGYAFVQGSARAQLTLKSNGQVRVKDFPAGSNDSYHHTLQLPAIPATTYELSGVVELHQDPDTGGKAYVDVLSIDAEIR